jgi:hypothetical protein
MVAFAQELIAAASAHQLVTVFFESGFGVGGSCRHRDQYTHHSELGNTNEHTALDQS